MPQSIAFANKQRELDLENDPYNWNFWATIGAIIAVKPGVLHPVRLRRRAAGKCLR
jgi:hypothetical protein